MNERRILGIDPGTTCLGYSIIEQKGKKLSLLCMDVFKMTTKDEMSLRMKQIFDHIIGLVDKFHPDVLSIEAPFYGKNIGSMLKLSRVQGVCISACFARDIPFMEYEPRKIKQSVTGNGASSKEQVAKMLQMIIGFKDMPKQLDATDAMAVAVCYANENNMLIPESVKKSLTQIYKKKTKQYGWNSFVALHPDRIKEKE